jgi:hypothetical protein
MRGAITAGRKAGAGVSDGNRDPARRDLEDAVFVTGLVVGLFVVTWLMGWRFW